jgi:hypothetical protein
MLGVFSFRYVMSNVKQLAVPRWRSGSASHLYSLHSAVYVEGRA